MQPSDFGIDTDTLPALKFDEAEGRRLLNEMNKVPTFKRVVYETKLLYFHHYMKVHVKASGVPDIRTLKKGDEKQWIADNQILWNKLSDMVDRHMFMFITAFASINANVLDTDNLDVISCASYDPTVLNSAYSLLVGHMIASTANYRVRNKVRRGLDIVVAAESARRSLDNDLASTERIVSDFMQSIESVDYGKHFKHGSDD